MQVCLANAATASGAWCSTILLMLMEAMGGSAPSPTAFIGSASKLTDLQQNADCTKTVEETQGEEHCESVL